MLSYSSYMLTAVAALLVTCDAQHKGPGIPGLPRKHGLKGQTYLPRDPMRPGTLMGPPRRGNRPWTQALPELYNALAVLKHRLSQLEGAGEIQTHFFLERQISLRNTTVYLFKFDLVKNQPNKQNKGITLKLHFPHGFMGPPQLCITLLVFLSIDNQIVKVLALNGKIREAGEKIIASNGKVVGFTSALESCEKAGGTLARPTNKEENEAILSFVQQYNKYAYLGIKEHENSGQFRHIYGTPLNYTNWHRNEPNGKGTEKCVEMYSDGSWNDKNCNQHRLIICEF